MLTTSRMNKLVNQLVYGMPNRYGNLVKEIRRHKSRRILEIGTWNGQHSSLMISAALENTSPSQVEFYGFDLFEEAYGNEILLPGEATKQPPNLEQVKISLQPYKDLGVKVFLHKGNTAKILPPLLSSLSFMDFVFIDGGHSYEIVKNDWDCICQIINPTSVVIFDDYLNQEGVNIMGFGINRLIDELDRHIYRVSFLEPVDRFKKDWGVMETRFVCVRLM